MDDTLRRVLAYHEATKHHFHRFARSLGYLDWETQPDPFREFAGAPRVALPFARPGDSPPYEALYRPECVAPTPLSAASLGALVEHALAISAWKAYGEATWALRCNPSSGNLHPTEGYLITGPVDGLSDTPSVWHYAPRHHALERRADVPLAAWAALVQGFPPGTVFVGLTSIHWREAWKYGERAWRYCQHDAGHAMAALALSAAALGWDAVHLEGLGDDDVAALLGLDRAKDFHAEEREAPDAIVALCPLGKADVPRTLAAGTATAMGEAVWHGCANRLSSEHVAWPIINDVAAANWKPRTEAAPATPLPNAYDAPADGPPAWQIIKQRRSAVEMDGETSIDRDQFYAMLARTVPALCARPWRVLSGRPRVHLALFVHRVTGLAPGLYALARDVVAVKPMRAAMAPAFHWILPPECPQRLPLYLLAPGDWRHAAARLSCGQAIAGDGAFSLGMLAELENTLEALGPWAYRRLFWETGMIGQVLYLEAEAAGVRATGIGCYFDDPVHEALGLRGHAYQSLYHFTVGGPIDDPRITSLPPYDHA